MPLLSICIPVYNAEPYLEQCLEPLLKIGKDVQVILSDDGSTDGSVALCEKLTSGRSEFIILRGENGGPSAARNRALKAVTGDYVLFCDADDRLEESTISELKTVISKQEVDFIQFGVVTELPGKSVRKQLLYDSTVFLSPAQLHELFAFVCGYEDGRNIGHAYFGLITCKIFKREILENLEFDCGVVGEDTLYAVQALKRVKSACFLPKYLYHYRIVPGSYSHRPYPEIVPKAQLFLNRLNSELLPEYEDDAAIKSALLNRAYGMLLWCINATGLATPKSLLFNTAERKRLYGLKEFSPAVSSDVLKKKLRREILRCVASQIYHSVIGIGRKSGKA